METVLFILFVGLVIGVIKFITGDKSYTPYTPPKPDYSLDPSSPIYTAKAHFFRRED